MGRLNSTFWQGVGLIGCVQSRVKKAVFDQFTGGTNQVGFLKLALGRAVLLQEVTVINCSVGFQENVGQ